MAAIIAQVNNDSIAQEMEIELGDKLLTINGQDINDILDYQFWSQDDELELEIEKINGEIWSLEIEKDWNEDLGLAFDGIVFDHMRVCTNRCVFCFIDQLPPTMRTTLYVKDDDYRYSFLYGNFITLTNLSEADWKKIELYRLSPLYVSVHTTDPDLRRQMLNNPRAKQIKNQLARLQNAGIEVHIQIVLCPGINDGLVLKQTIDDLAHYYPAVVSIGIVPVGLTEHRQGLYPLSACSPEQARQVITWIDEYQAVFRQQWGIGLVYLADEFYVKAGQMVPNSEYYDDYPQLENGIGLMRLLLDDWQELEADLPTAVWPKEFFCLTGRSAMPVMSILTERFNQIQGLQVHLVPVDNDFFGRQITVTGLLTGSDIIKTLAADYSGKKVIITNVVFKPDSYLFLDDVSLDEVKQASGVDIVVIDGSVEALIKVLVGEDGGIKNG